MTNYFITNRHSASIPHILMQTNTENQKKYYLCSGFEKDNFKADFIETLGSGYNRIRKGFVATGSGVRVTVISSETSLQLKTSINISIKT